MTKSQPAADTAPRRRPGRPRSDLPEDLLAHLGELSRQQLARVLGISPSTVDRLRGQGMPESPGGTFNLAAVWRWRDAHFATLITAAAKAGTKEDALESFRRVRTAREQLRLEHDQGMLLERDAVAEEWRRRVLTVRAKLLALPRTLAGRCANAPADIVDAEAGTIVRDVLEEFAAGGDLAPACDLVVDEAVSWRLRVRERLLQIPKDLAERCRARGALTGAVLEAEAEAIVLEVFGEVDSAAQAETASAPIVNAPDPGTDASSGAACDEE